MLCLLFNFSQIRFWASAFYNVRRLAAKKNQQKIVGSVVALIKNDLDVNL